MTNLASKMQDLNINLLESFKSFNPFKTSYQYYVGKNIQNTKNMS